MKVVQLTQKDVQVGLIIALYSADNAVKSIDSAKYTILYSALILKSRYKVSYLLEKVIKNNLLLDNAAMLTVSNTVSCDHGEMNGLFG